MATFLGGFYVEASGADAVRDIYQEALQFLEEEWDAEPADPKGWKLVVEAREGSPFMFVELAQPVDAKDRLDSFDFAQDHPAFPSGLSSRLDCVVAAFGFDSRTEYEFVELFEGGHQTEMWTRGLGDDDSDESGDEDSDESEDSRDNPPLTRLASEYGVSREALFDLCSDSHGLDIPLDQPLSEERLRQYFAALAPMPRPPAPAEKANLRVALPQSVINAATALATQQGMSFSETIRQAFENMLPLLRERIEQDPDALSRQVATAGNDPRVFCELHLPEELQKTLQKLIVLSDRPAGWLLCAAFRLSQSR
ncbi:hypothetical protein HPC49_02965 [Pyxidicoccus fallax]|uniref:Uncharacterized protein n=1 Tax=Pyxidicoccus fallax TaxID=394095 RepID=A0A848L9C7_9BACT|nr:hypothetical protein [Pyxidicoccus fallax]NMO15620.1 hypothetical protein [Pyxidicoccus fallax]NPC77217.1 hypothetical protein [Pyxidicoccus fallax]